MLATKRSTKSLDLEYVAQRILALTEMATAEHLKSLSRSQADRLVEMVQNERSERRQTLISAM